MLFVSCAPNESSRCFMPELLTLVHSKRIGKWRSCPEHGTCIYQSIAMYQCSFLNLVHHLVGYIIYTQYIYIYTHYHPINIPLIPINIPLIPINTQLIVHQYPSMPPFLTRRSALLLVKFPSIAILRWLNPN